MDNIRLCSFVVLVIWLLQTLLPTHADSAEASSSALVGIDCSSMSNNSYTISNATLTPAMRFYNCTNSSVTVNVAACGVSAESPLIVEVVGGIAVPTFTLRGCLVGHGNDAFYAFENVSLTIRGVTMQYKGDDDDVWQQHNRQRLFLIAANDFGNPMSSTLFSMPVSASSVTIMVTDSRLTWVASESDDAGVNGGLLISCQGTDVNVTIANTTMMAWTNRTVATFIRPVGINNRMYLNIEKNSTLVLLCNADGGLNSTLSFVGGYENTTLISNSIIRLENIVCIVNATASTVTPMQFLLLSGAVTNITLTVLNIDTTASCGHGLKFVRVAAYYGADGVRVTVEGGTFRTVLTVTDASLTSVLVPGVVVVMLNSMPKATNIDITVRNLSLTTTIDYRSLSKPLLAPTAVGSVGTHGAVMFSQLPVSHCVVKLANVAILFEEMGSLSISPYAQVAQFGFSVTALLYGVVVFYGNASEFVNFWIANSSLVVSQQDSTFANSAIYSSPTVLSGVVIRSASVIVVFAVLRNGHLTVTNCTIASTAFMFSTAKTTPVWNGVGIISHASIGSFVQADQPQFAPFFPDAFSSGVISDSEIYVGNCTVTGPVLNATIMATIAPSVFRLSVAIVTFFNMHNTTTTIVASSSSSSTTFAATSSQELRECVCLAAVSLVPSSTISNSRIALWNNDTTTPPVPSFLCASGPQVTMSSVHLDMDGVTIQGADVNGQGIRDGLSLAPASSRFETTLLLTNVSLRLSRTTSISLRSVLGNATATTSASQARFSHNMVFASDPVVLTIPSCSSNLWDGEAMTCANVLRPLDGQHRVNWSLVRIEIDDHQDGWCAVCPAGATLTPLLVTRSLVQQQSQRRSTIPYVSSAVTTAVLALAMLTSSTGAASAVPRLQGMVGTLRLAARCVATSSDSGDDSSSSNYAGTDISDNPLLLHLPIASSLSYAAGALMGNTLLVVGVAVVSHTMSLLEKWVNRETIDTNSFVSQFSSLDLHKPQSSLSWYQRRLRTFAALCCSVLPTTPLPASLQCQQGFLLQPVAAAAMVCLLSSDRGATSVLLAMIIGVAWIAVPCTFMWVVCVKYSPLPLKAITTRSVDSKDLCWERGGRMLEWLCTEREEWIAAGRGRLVKHRFGAVFEGYRGGRHWYFGVDALLSVLTGVTVGVAESVTDEDACTAAMWGTACIGAIAAVSAVLCIVLRPHVVRFELLAAVAVSFLAVLEGVLILADDVNASGVVSLVASVAELLPLAAALVWKCCHVHRSTTPYETIAPSERILRKGGISIDSGQRSVSNRRQRRQAVNMLSCKTTTRQPTEAMIQQDEVLKALLVCICKR